MRFIPAFLILLASAAVCSAQAGGSPTIAVNTPTANVFGFSTSIYQTSWGNGTAVKFHGDCYQFWRTAVTHVTPPTYTGFWKQTHCTGAYVAYAGASLDLAGGACSGGPPGTLFCDNVNNNGINGCNIGVDTHNDKLVCLFFDINAAGTSSNGVYFSTTSDAVTWTTPVIIPNHYWSGSAGYMKGPTKLCYYAAGNHANTSFGDQYELCTTDDVTWTNDAQISVNENPEAGIWYDSTGRNGLVVIRNTLPAPVHIGTTTNGGATWTIVNSNVVGVSPACAISGGTLQSDTFAGPFLFAASYPSGKVTLLTTDRQVCGGAGVTSVMNNYLVATTFDPTVVIANPASLPPLQVIYTGVSTNAQVDCGYAGVLQSGGVNLTFGWGCPYPANHTPVLFQMTGHYVVSFAGTTVAAGAKVRAGVQIK